jgi:nicotinamide riboside kinase
MASTLHPATRIVVVTGPPASGKTTLALAVSERRAHKKRRPAREFGSAGAATPLELLPETDDHG